MLTKIIFIIITFSFSFSQAVEIAMSKTFDIGDSQRIENALSNLGPKQITQDNSDPSIVRHQSQFRTFDNALMIECIRTIHNSLDLGAKCEITIDSNLSQPNVTEVFIGAVGEVIIVNLLNINDISLLKDSLTKISGHFTSTTKVPVILENLSIVEQPLFRADCRPTDSFCSVSIFP